MLLVEDDSQLGEVVKAFLDMHDISVVLCVNGADALSTVKKYEFHCIVLDLNLPDEDGLVVLRKIRRFNQVPVIICSARGSTDERITGLEFGAQDYLPKPYSTKELVLKIKRLVDLCGMNYTEASMNPPTTIYQIDTDRKGLIHNDTQRFIRLTIAEYYLFKTLAQHEGRVYSREELIDATSNINGPENARSVDISISRLRKKLETESDSPKIIITDRGFGYHLNNKG